MESREKKIERVFKQEYLPLILKMVVAGLYTPGPSGYLGVDLYDFSKISINLKHRHDQVKMKLKVQHERPASNNQGAEQDGRFRPGRHGI
ncbi:MAG: hypothetical protein HQK60_18280 [Deltaproteobacteria bacterium]|nr:hypothetical protein [Deltaproteobacteria bacterium]